MNIIRKLMEPSLARNEAERIAQREAAEKAKIAARAPVHAAVDAARKQEMGENLADAAWCGVEHQKTIAELATLDLMQGPEADELVESLEFVFVALSRFNAAAAQRVAQAGALDAKAVELGAHLHAKHGVSVVGRGAPNDHGSSAKDLWSRAAVSLQDAVASMGAQHGTALGAWLLERLTLGMSRANHAAAVERSKARDEELAQARHAKLARDNPGVSYDHKLLNEADAARLAIENRSRGR